MLPEIRRKRERNARRIAGVYALIDPEHCAGRNCLDVATAALAGGASVIQLRDKKRDKGRVLEDAWRLRELTRHANAALIINDHVDVARLCNATGVHLGQFDIPVDAARLILADEQIVGTSNAGLQQLDSSLNEKKADYAAVGAIYRTETKPRALMFGVAGLKQARARVPRGATPLVAIGGINLDNAAAVVNCGVDAVCVGTAISAADDPEWATRALAALFKK